MINRGSEWRRWEPHIHAPGTVMNNQFSGENPWDDYINALEQATPIIEAIAVTDYYITDTYQKVLEYKNTGRLPNVALIFPNVELRLDVATAKGGFINLHLFVSPEDADHVDQLNRILSRLQFNVMQDRFDCTRSDLIRLGKRAASDITDDHVALSHGASQFKVNFKQLREVYTESSWAKKNILIGVAGGATDGTSGVREAADQTIRREIEGFAHIIFASSESQREYWLGRKPSMSSDDIRCIYGGLKPCLHGSDAHDIKSVASPFGDRFSWIKGGLEFDSLRQACIDPADRAYVGSAPPTSATPSQVLSSIEVLNAPWLKTSSIPLNPGLVAIIGARGSGKTALADMIAAGCDSIPSETWKANEWANPSFLVRARPIIGEAKVNVEWAAGFNQTRALNGSDAHDPYSYERVRYLSQQFVEELCSSNGLTDGLLREIERVIFEAHTEDTRNGALNFTELLEQRASRYRIARSREVEAVTQISDRISAELEKEQLLAGYEADVVKKNQLVEAYTADLAKLVSKGSETRAQRHTELASAATQIRARIRQLSGQQQTILAMQDEVNDMRRNQAPEELRQTQARHEHSGMTQEQWAAFLIDYTGPVDDYLAGFLKWLDAEIAKLKGAAPSLGDPNTAYFDDSVDLSSLSLAMLDAEMERLGKLVNADKDAQRRYAAVSKTIATESSLLQTLKEKSTDAKGAKERIRQLQKEREIAYGRAFDALIAEQSVLEELYAPLMSRLAASAGSLQKLSFSVARIADVALWAESAEDGLIDLRKAGAFRGKGTLQQKANDSLRTAWEKGDSSSVIAAMEEFRRLYQKDLLDHSPVARTEQAEFRSWLKRFGQWLFSINHIEIQYGINYDGVDIRKLSPGTRGIVLLLLYLALDDKDDRPLLIDQPEENLDPKSVFDELVPLFVQAKAHRQVIMVTHNANLVINTNADQIIIAESGSHPHGELPSVTYRTGGLENSEIRKEVCKILEGGEAAFQERARRLRVRLDR